MQRKRDGLVPVREALSGLGGFAATVEDFEKLLLARAGVRLMIFDGNYKPGSKGIAEQLAGRVREFNGSRAEDAYLLAAWERNANGWSFRYLPGFPFWPRHGHRMHPRCAEYHVFSR